MSEPDNNNNLYHQQQQHDWYPSSPFPFVTSPLPSSSSIALVDDSIDELLPLPLSPTSSNTLHSTSSLIPLPLPSTPSLSSDTQVWQWSAVQQSLDNANNHASFPDPLTSETFITAAGGGVAYPSPHVFVTTSATDPNPNNVAAPFGNSANNGASTPETLTVLPMSVNSSYPTAPIPNTNPSLPQAVAAATTTPLTSSSSIPSRVVACLICHQHKTKCDGQRPCSRWYVSYRPTIIVVSG
jgi:hypothetical protein